MEEKGQLVSKRGLTKSGIEFVAKLYTNGLGYRRIAKALGINPSAARYWTVKLGLNRRGKIAGIAKCRFCGKNFYVVAPLRALSSKFCSRECADKWRKNNPPQPRIIKPDLKPSGTLAYVLGCLKGDGYVSLCKKGNWKVCMQVKDRYFAESFLEALGSIRLNPKIYGPNRRGIYTVEARSREFVKWYKSLSLGRLEEIVRSSGETGIVGFVRGFFESEGCNSFSSDKNGRNYWKISMSNKNLELLVMVKKFLCLLGLEFGISAREDVYVLHSGAKNRNADFIRKIRPHIKNMLHFAKDVKSQLKGQFYQIPR